MERRKKKKRPTLASRADKYDLYQQAVQDPDFEVRLIDRVFRKEFGRPPMILREDFCGTALISCAWVKSRAGRSAYGLDIDPAPLAWARKNNLPQLSTEERERITLIRGDVRTARTPDVDVVTAQNFSYFVFHRRDELLTYFRGTRAHLKKEGLFLIDLMGGPNCQREDFTDRHRKRGFTYIWHHDKFDPITHRTICRMHFMFPDGSKMRNAFIYDWRLWTIPELRDALHDVGFSRSDVYWEGTDHATGRGNGVFYLREKAESDPSWIAYIVAIP